MIQNKLFIGLLIMVTLSSCYKLEDNAPVYEDGHSTIVHDLPGDTLASDGWGDDYEEKDTYLRQRYYNSSWTDSIRIVPWGNELINAAKNVDGNMEESIIWLSSATAHPARPKENDAYTNTSDGHQYIYRSGAWYQVDIDIKKITSDNDGAAINWRGYVAAPPISPQLNWAYRDNDNERTYIYNGTAWALMVSDANYNSNIDFVNVQYSKSGKDNGKYNIFIYRFSDGWRQFIRDAADSARYLPTADWDIAFTGEFNSLIWINNAKYRTNPGYGGPVTRSSLWMYDYGYDFMKEAPEDAFFDAIPAQQLQIGYASQYGQGTNPWYEYGSTFIAQPFPYRAYYLRLERLNPKAGETAFLYGKLQLISLYKGAPEVITDRNWPSPYLTFRYFIQEDGSRNLKTKD